MPQALPQNNTGDSSGKSSADGNRASSAPSISLPKGGGAIRGMGEKFAANPVTGTGSLTVPIATSPGRSGFGPQLSLSYDSGAGNGPFGFGWSLSLPSITRKTDKGLPLYRDAEESDVFILSGAEDLVPVFKKDLNGNWLPDAKGGLVLDEEVRDGYLIRRYRPRIEGLFARIERWTLVGDPHDVHWRSISKDNILTLYGSDSHSRIFDPEDASRIFSWLICETRDDKGNAVVYQYKTEDGAGVDLAQANERNRGWLNDARRAANRYLKRIQYGNCISMLDNAGHRPRSLTQAQLGNAAWMFEVVFDYADHDPANPGPRDDEEKDSAGKLKWPWSRRHDPFSSYRAGFEVRTYRRCRRVLMFHHIPDPAAGEKGYEGLVRSTDFSYSFEQNPADASEPIYSFLLAVTQTGYQRSPLPATVYISRSLPPVGFTYSQATIQAEVREVDAASLENLPSGLDVSAYQWVDLDGEGLSGILSEQTGGWFYKRNLSPINIVRQNGLAHVEAQFAPVELVANRPASGLAAGHAQFLDLAGDGQPDLVTFRAPTPGFYERTADASGWATFTAFASLPVLDWDDPNLKFVDLSGDGHADVLISEDNVFRWYPSLAEEGFGPQEVTRQARDEESGPHLVFADSTQSIYLADMSGDGLSDLVRIRNGEVCYWPNLGYGRFGAKVAMDNSPWFDFPDQFDQKRIRLADIDGSGASDILYLHGDGVRIYFNQSGNSWSHPPAVPPFPRIDNQTSVNVVDLLGNGTACLVWSSPLPSDARRPMRYIDLMGGQKPHLLIKTVNNLGAETRVAYAPSSKFYLQDKYDGKPWITRLPFPVHVVERVETYDHISRNHFVTRYAYHHGYFDGEEREFRGFGMVEQWDTEELAALTGDGTLPAATNLDAASHVPPVLTKTWFHTGVYLGREHISDFFAGLLDAADKGEYYREPGLDDDQARALLLPDSVLPPGLTLDEEREACRALKGSMLRQEVYALDGTPKAAHPYTVSEQNFTIQHLQPRGGNRHAVFFTHAREAISYHYERNPADPRVTHALTLQVDRYGNVLKSANIGYGRRLDAPDPALLPKDHDNQKLIHITCTENRVTAPIDDDALYPGDYHTPLPAETRTFELRKPQQEKSIIGPTLLYRFDDILTHVLQAGDGSHDIDYEDRLFVKAAQAAAINAAEGQRYFRRVIEHIRTLYRPDDLGAAQNDPLTLLPMGSLQPRALPGESYKLAFTPGLLARIFQRSGHPLLPNPAGVLGGLAADRGGYLPSQQLKGDGRFPSTDPDDQWWIPSGRMFYAPTPNDPPAPELAFARTHFFLPHRIRDPFHTTTISTESFVSYDSYNLLVRETCDALGNRVTVGERNTDPTQPPVVLRQDYRVLQPALVMDPNRNRIEVAFDALGMVVGTAVMGKPGENKGDSLSNFEAGLTQTEIVALHDAIDPHAFAKTLLNDASTRIVYDLDRFHASQQAHPGDSTQWAPAYAATLARETHFRDPPPPQGLKLQISFSYSDGFGREIQKKIQAEPGNVEEKDAAGNITVVDTTPIPRWVGSGWTIFNNKGKPVRQYEPFFSSHHQFQFGKKVSVSPILFYDPVERVVATLHPNHTYEKVAFDPWQQQTYDVNDTVRLDPSTDDDVKGFFVKPDGAARIPTTEYLPTWYSQRIGNLVSDPERDAAQKAAVHADTPTTAHVDSLGRPFLTLADNGPEPANAGQHLLFATRIELDIEGNQCAVRDAIEQVGEKLGRIVMRYDYDMLSNRIHQASMEAGERWMLNDVLGKPIRAWDSRGHGFRTEYDPMRRPLRSFVAGDDPARPNQELLTDRLVYGEQHQDAELRNLRGKLFLRLDQAGSVTNEAYDFKGNPLLASRRLTKGMQYKQTVDWHVVDADPAALPTDATKLLDLVALGSTLALQLETDTYSSSTTYDALNRPALLTTPHTPAMQANVIRPGYNEANLLERVDAMLRGASANGQSVWTHFVSNIDYDAKGQRTLVEYGNGVTTTYDYDPLTFRLIHMLAKRNAIVFPDDCPPPPTAVWPGCQVQNLSYTYDPASNITHMRDDAQQTIYFDNLRVEPSADYTYDALYRLIKATGREHLGQVGGTPIPHSHDDARRTGILSPGPGSGFHPNDGAAMGRYCESYDYDAVGNIMSMIHRLSCPGVPSWTRTYAYDEPSLIEDGKGGTSLKTSNRLSSTTVGSNNPPVESYVYDAHGNMTRMPHLGGASPTPNMHWDYRDQLRQTDLGGGGTAYYVYDSAGHRVRKVTESGAGQVKDERIYLGGLEIYRQNGANPLVRETLHVMDDKQRIALVETRTQPTTPDPKDPLQLIRYQFGNHLGSASLELDEQAQIISYEEYTPYGSTSYQAVRSQTEAPKRYRYTGKERDEESGLYYHGARYYAPWLGRWSSCDPTGLSDSNNIYCFVIDQPVSYRDPTGHQHEESLLTPKSTVPLTSGVGLSINTPLTSTAQANASVTRFNLLSLTADDIRKQIGTIAPGLGGQNRIQDIDALTGPLGGRLLNAFFSTSERLKLDPAFLMSVAFQEGLRTLIPDKLRAAPNATVDSFSDLGIDRFKREFGNLKAEGLLPDGFERRFTNGATIPNEKGEMVQTVNFNRIEDAIDALAALLVSREHLVRNDLLAQGIDPTKMTGEELQFWTYVYYNAGSGSPEDPKGTGRAHLLQSISSGSGTSIPTNVIQAPGDTGLSLGNAQRVIGEVRLFKMAGVVDKNP